MIRFLPQALWRAAPWKWKKFSRVTSLVIVHLKFGCEITFEPVPVQDSLRTHALLTQK